MSIVFSPYEYTHAGIEITVKEITKEVMVHGGLRQLIMNVKGVVIIEIDKKDYLDFQGLNDPKPEVKKVVWIKKEKGKIVKEFEKMHHFDEITERKEYHGSENEYGFECIFSGHFVQSSLFELSFILTIFLQ